MKTRRPKRHHQKTKHRHRHRQSARLLLLPSVLVAGVGVAVDVAMPRYGASLLNDTPLLPDLRSVFEDTTTRATSTATPTLGGVRTWWCCSCCHCLLSTVSVFLFMSFRRSCSCRVLKKGVTTGEQRSFVQPRGTVSWHDNRIPKQNWASTVSYKVPQAYFVFSILAIQDPLS